MLNPWDVDEKTVPETPQDNGTTKRINCIMVDKVRSMLSMAKLPMSLSDEADQTSDNLLLDKRSLSISLGLDIAGESLDD